MTAAAQAGALSRVEVNWPAIDWQAAHRSVRRLQARIVKATQEKRGGKVKALQHLLTHSFSGKALAVKQVTENSGKRTSGVDRILWGTDQPGLLGYLTYPQLVRLARRHTQHLSAEGQARILGGTARRVSTSARAETGRCGRLRAGRRSRAGHPAPPGRRHARAGSACCSRPHPAATNWNSAVPSLQPGDWTRTAKSLPNRRRPETA